MFNLLFAKSPQQELVASKLFDETTFYQAFLNNLKGCKQELIIESPYITTNRMRLFWPIFERLLKRNVTIYIITKDFDDLDENLRQQSEVAIQNCEHLGIQVLLCIGNHHRKLAMIDRKILWEGSLNILSQTHSREIMRRIESRMITKQTFDFLRLGRFI